MTARRFLWLAVAVVLAVGVPFLVFSTQTFTCADFVEPGVDSCTSEPALGWPVSVIVSLIALVLAAAAVRRSAREPRA